MANERELSGLLHPTNFLGQTNAVTPKVGTSEISPKIDKSIDF